MTELTKEQILTRLFQSSEMTDLINRMQPANLRDEIKQELFLTLCEKPAETIESLHESGGLKFYVTRIVMNMVQSSTSPFFKKYRRIITVDKVVDQRDDSDEVIEQKISDDAHQNLLLSEVNRLLEEMHPYRRELFKLYMEHGSVNKVVAHMKTILGGRYIPSRTIYEVIKKVKEELRASTLQNIQPSF